MPRRMVALLHLGYWSLYLFVAFLLLAIAGAGAVQAESAARALFTFRIGFILVVPSAAGFYLSYCLLFPHFLARKRFLALVLGGVAGAVSIPILATVVLFLVLGPAEPLFRSRGELLGMIAWLAGSVTVHMTVAAILRGFIAWYDDIAIKAELTRRTAEVESDLIRAKLDPHFLFNTLNNLDALIIRDPVVASEYLARLTGLMRFVLYEARAERILLGLEIEYIERYVALEAIRSRNPKRSVLRLTGTPGARKIAPMLLIPFVENAFKHAAGQRMEDAVVIEIDLEGSRLRFRCANHYAPASEPTAPEEGAARSGIGQQLAARRLALLYPASHELAVTRVEGIYDLRLAVDLDETA
ncbi:MAG: sensor histidine kinase [Candidatus Eisenbacteria bacterium]|nr:sensor histidine kinase [Candidatus Eisenbacteria bacterium]